MPGRSKRQQFNSNSTRQMLMPPPSLSRREAPPGNAPTVAKRVTSRPTKSIVSPDLLNPLQSPSIITTHVGRGGMGYFTYFGLLQLHRLELGLRRSVVEGLIPL